MTRASDPATADRAAAKRAAAWRSLLPFADAASAELPLPRLLRLSLFQVSVGMATVLLTGTLNRVMILELGLPAWLVAAMVSLPLVFAPLRALIGHKSDTHRSLLGWRRGPYIWFGSLLQFGGLAIMPFALIVLSGDSTGPAWAGPAGAALAFLLVGAGMHTTQTAGLALATDLAPADARPRVVALLYVALLFGVLGSALVFSALLAEFSQLRLIRVIQGAALATMLFNLVALWRQEARDTQATALDRDTISFGQAWTDYIGQDRAKRLLFGLAVGTAAFAMQDVLLEPYGGEVLGLSVAGTTLLTALAAAGALGGFGLAAWRLTKGADPYRIAGLGSLIGVAAFACVILAGPLQSPMMFRTGAALIGLGGGLFSVGMLTAAMDLAAPGQSGIALGAWGAVQATAAGSAIALGGGLSDLVGALSAAGRFGSALTSPATGYGAVYHVEILLLFVALAAVGPLARYARPGSPRRRDRFGLADFPS